MIGLEGDVFSIKTCVLHEKSLQENRQSISAKNLHGQVSHNNAHGPMVDCVDVVATRLDLT
jgi:hypothetical protein